MPNRPRHFPRRFKRRGPQFRDRHNAFTLREQLLDIQPFNGSLVVVDQSCTPRQSHLLPQDCKPQDFVPLTAPDWRPKIDTNGNVALSVREFLIACTVMRIGLPRSIFTLTKRLRVAAPNALSKPVTISNARAAR